MNLLNSISRQIWPSDQDSGRSLSQLAFHHQMINAAKVCLKENDVLLFEPKETCNIFRRFYENFAQSFMDKLPPPSNKFNLDTTKAFYDKMNIANNFKLQAVDQASILKMLKKLM